MTLIDCAIGLSLCTYLFAYWQLTVYEYNRPAIPEARLIRG